MNRNDPRSDDDRIHQLVGEYIDRLNQGQMLDEETILSDHPDIGPQLLEKLELFQAVGGSLGRHAALGSIGDYQLTREVGRGGMAVVYEAWESSMDRAVALKVLPVGAAANDKTFHRFMREARTAGKLHHANVVPVYGVGIKDNTPYYAMELVEGETLAQILARLRGAEGEEEQNRILQGLSRVFARNGQATEPAEISFDGTATEALQKTGPTAFDADEVNLVYCARLAAAFAGVAEGLQHAHSKGVVHRDIKPSNLIVDRDQRIRILDFGLARLEGHESLTVSGDLMGTVLYMSPEQAMARRIPVDQRTDVYSLGATMYEMLAWRPPFQGSTHQDTLTQIIFRDPEALRRLRPGIPKDLETIVLKCLRKDPVDRYGTAEALAQDLSRFVRGDPVEARPESAAEKLTRKFRQNRGRIAVAGVLLLLCAVCGVLSYRVWDLGQREHRMAVERAREERTKKLVSVLATWSADAVRVPWKEGAGPTRRVFSFSTTADGLTLYYDMLGRMESPFDIWQARRTGIREPFEAGQALLFPVNSEFSEWVPTLSPDGDWLYFTSDRDGPFEMYAAARTDPSDPHAPFDRLVKLDAVVNRGFGFPTWVGCVSYDGNELYYVAGQNWDIWMATFIEAGNPAAGFADAQPLTVLNTPHQALAPRISRDGTMLFFSDRPERLAIGRPPRPGGRGGSDLWVALRCRFPNGSFGPWDEEPHNLHSLNTSQSEHSPWLSTDGTTLFYSLRDETLPLDDTLRQVSLVGFGCGERPLRARRRFDVETISVHHGERPAWTPGEVYRVTMELSEVREASELCGPANDVVIEETVPEGWTPGRPSACGEITAEGTIRWTLRRGECGSGSFPEFLSYEVEAAGEADVARFNGTIADAVSSVKFPVEGDHQLFSRADFSRQGFIRRWLLLGPYRVTGPVCTHQPAANETMRIDYLTDQREINEDSVLPRDGERMPSGDTEAGVRLASASAGVDINREGVPTWHAWRSEDDTVDFDEYYGLDVNGIMMYAVVYLQVENDIDAQLGLASDDSVQVLLDGKEVFVNSIARHSGAKGRVQDHAPIGSLAAGRYVLMVKVFDICADHSFRLRLENPRTGEPLTEKDGIKVCVDPKECGY